jgi:hypothetical protein
MSTPTVIEKLPVNQEFSKVATDEQIARTARALEANKFRPLVAENGEAARKLFFEVLPEGAKVYSGASITLDSLGITEVIENSGKYDALRPKVWKLDRQTQGDEIRRLGASPDFMVGSVHALTEDGHALVASFSGSQIGAYASGAGQVIWVVGAQKIVRDTAEGLRRIQEYSYPLEDERAQGAYKMRSAVNRVLIYNADMFPGRTTIIIVKEKIGF